MKFFVCHSFTFHSSAHAGLDRLWRGGSGDGIRPGLRHGLATLQRYHLSAADNITAWIEWLHRLFALLIGFFGLATNAAMAFVVILTGALVRGSGATLACTTWPLCDGGAILPVAQGQLAIINMIHRFSVAAMSIALFILIWQVHRYRTEPLTRRIALGAAVTHIVQIVAGALFVLSSAGREWGAIHVGLAAAVWGLLVTLAIMEGMNRESLEMGNL